MIRMGMVKPQDIQLPLPPFELGFHKILRLDLKTVVLFLLLPGISYGDNIRSYPIAVFGYPAQDDAAAFIGVVMLPLPENGSL
jgi:hypothetical protein